MKPPSTNFGATHEILIYTGLPVQVIHSEDSSDDSSKITLRFSLIIYFLQKTDII